MVMEVVDYDLSLQTDRMVVTLDVLTKFLPGFTNVELRVARDRLDQLVIAADWRIRTQHVKNKSFLNRLLHRVTMEWWVKHSSIGLRTALSKELECFRLGSGREREVAGVNQELLRLHHPIDFILDGFILVLSASFR